MNRAAELRLDSRLGRLAGLSWRRDDAPRVLALHGWLDNAASFLPLAPMLDRLDLVALDLPGHGHSDHRHRTARYHFVDYLFDLDAALDALGWEECHLLGHSLGASIAVAYAAGAPERVRSMVLLDALGPLAASADTTAERLQRSLRKNRRGSSEPRRYDSIDEMVAARRQATSDLSEEAARLIVERATRADGAHFSWRSDPALNWVSALVMTEEQVLDLLGHVLCPALTIQATPTSSWFSVEKIAARKAALPHADHQVLEGHHHFHMDQPGAIAQTVQSFFLEHDQPPPASSETGGNT